MKRICTPDEMRLAESEYMRREGIDSRLLMERAAHALVNELCDRLGGAEGRSCVFLCGPGGNGGDGCECARLFAERGGRAILLEALPGAKWREDADFMRKRALRTSNVWLSESAEGMPRPGAWVDAAFGTGLSRAPGAETALLFARVAADRRAGSFVLSCDIPSGIDGATGLAPGAYIEADATVAFQWAKPGHYLGEGMDASGELRIADIGIPECFAPDGALMRIEPDDLRAICAPRRRNTHKGTYGHLLLIAGSAGMAGAACIAANAALRSGAGLVTVACPEPVMPIVQILAPCAMCLPLPHESGALCDEAVPAIREAIQGKSAIAIGPGLSRRCATAIVAEALGSGLPCCLDADALNLLSTEPELRALLHTKCVLTPHPGEAARLTGPAENALAAAAAMRKLGAVALYKGAATLILGERAYLSASGTPGMAKGGSGDALTGILGALLARGIDPETAAWAASEAHGLAGERAAAEKGEIGMTAEDIVRHVPEVWRGYGSKA